MVRPPGENGQNRLPKLAFSINPGDDGILKHPEEDGKIKNALSFRGTGLKIETFFMLTK
jgi:hypothetical protein